ncbi:unnamed protein product [Cunninghamella blakesleeana]
MSALPGCLKDSRCILHIDLDCFFSQVEEVRLGLDSTKPVAVQQWTSLIAVNYAARKYGVSRLSSVQEARKLCPNITLVHVATYAPNETVAKYHNNPSKQTHKVSLDSYRIAGKKIFNIFQEHCPMLQKVGSDEAFFDVTEIVNKRLCQEYIPTYSYLMNCIDDTFLPQHHSLDLESVANIIKSHDEEESTNNANSENESVIWDQTSWMDVQLYIGASIAKDIRKEVYDQLKYTCSAGIANNKLLAKLGSSMNKPNKQTIVRQHIAMEFMENISLSKIRNLGGKFGTEVVNEYKAEKASDLWKYDTKEFQTKFGSSSGLWLYNIVRGIDHEEVTPHKVPKSLVAAKSLYPPIKHHDELSPWFNVLSGEIYNRIITNFQDHQTWPRTLSVSYRCSQSGKYVSKSTSMLHRSELTSLEKLSRKVESLFTAIDIEFPCNHLSVMANGLIPSSIISNRSITSFFPTKFNNHDNTVNNVDEDDEVNIGEMSNLEEDKNNQIITSKKSLKRSLSAFFTNEPSTSSNAEELAWECDRCYQKVPIKDIDEHTDYHFAIDLSEQNSQQESESKKIKYSNS